MGFVQTDFCPSERSYKSEGPIHKEPITGKRFTFLAWIILVLLDGYLGDFLYLKSIPDKFSSNILLGNAEQVHSEITLYLCLSQNLLEHGLY